MADNGTVKQADVQSVLRQLYAATSSLPSKFKAWIEGNSPRLLALCHADAVMVSLSGCVGYGAAVGAGFELLYGPKFGWASYFQLGGGLASPGGGGALEVGLVWNLTNPSQYTEWFIEGAGSFKYMSLSGSVTPTALFYVATEGKVVVPFAVKGGGSAGSNQVALLAEYYWLLSGDTRVFPVGLDKQVSEEVARVKQWAIQNGLQHNQEKWKDLVEKLDAANDRFQRNFTKLAGNRNNREAAKECFLALDDLEYVRLRIYSAGVLSPRNTVGVLPDFKDEQKRLGTRYMTAR